MRGAKWGGLAVLAGLVGFAAAAEPAQDRTAARPISYAELSRLVRSQRGKVVVVDFWNTG